MPQNKPMKIQWITVNGRQVPLVLPQTYSYEIEDWKVTSDRDPLPVVEYGTTAGGIVVPKRVSDEGHELTQLTGSIVELYRVDNVTITAGSNYISPMIDLTDVKKVFAVVHSRQAILQKFSVYILWGHSSYPPNNWLGITDRFESKSSSQYGDSTVDMTGEYTNIKSPYARFRINNTTKDDDVYLLVVWGVV